MTTTTAQAGRVMQHLEFCHQVLWPELDVQMVSVTEQWAQFSVAGPRSRDVLRKLVDEKFDLADKAFPYLAAKELTVAGGIPARLFRLSFSGELAYELGVPARYGDAAIRAIMAAGAEFGITPYGTEALGVMRIEKGHVAGNEINGQLTARDLGLGRMMSTQEGLHRPRDGAAAGAGSTPTARRWSASGRSIAARGCAPARISSPVGAAATAENDEGYMTSVAFSPMLGHWIGLGLLARGPQRIGERVRAYDPVRNGDVEVEICNPVFFDPEGSAAAWLASPHGNAPRCTASRCRAAMARAPGAAGLLIEQRTDLSFASVIAKRGKRDQLISAVETAYGVALAQGSAPRDQRQRDLRRHRAGPVDRERRRAGSARTSPRACARVSACSPRYRTRPTRASCCGSPVRACATCWPRACRSTCTRKCSSQATSRPRWSPISACRSTGSTMPTFQLTAPRSMAGSFWSWLSASAAEFGYDVVTR